MTLNGKRILVAEDEPDEMKFITTILEDHGVTVFKAHNGTQALEMARSEKPDAMTLDISMPGMDVMMLLRELKGDNELPDLKICIISGRPELRLILSDRHLNTNAYLDKPFTERDLVDKLEELLAD
ncbi:MAG: response regulator [Acidobacteria bacterium]|nr:response regulator [Acidobacteriota bacterium]